MDSDSDTSVVLNISDDEYEDQEFPDASDVSQPPSLEETGQNLQGDQENHNMDTPSLHSYLGQELEVVRGRTVFEEDSIVTLDILQETHVSLMPGQTLPLTVHDPPTINMLRNCLNNDKTFGVLANWNGVQSKVRNCLGTTAEIYEYLPEDATAGFRVKALARQRFIVQDYETNRRRARVRILPEVKLLDPLAGVMLQSLRRFRSSPRMRHRCRHADAAVTRWPTFVYEQYSADWLAQQVKLQLKSTSVYCSVKKNTSANVVLSNDPTELSFWVAQNIPMMENQQNMMLRLDSPIPRLQWQLKALQQGNELQSKQALFCKFCMSIVGSGMDIFSMSAEGPQSTYVNPNGYLHETITLFRVRDIYSVGHPSTEYSWFPGYAWTISKCKHCSQHLGWKFSATKSSLKPAKFWGICRRSVTVKWVVPSPEESTATSNLMLV